MNFASAVFRDSPPHRGTTALLAAVCSALMLAGGVRALQAQSVRVPPVARIDSIFSAYQRTTSPGCGVAVVHGDSVIYRKAYGMAHIGFGVPMTTATTTWIPYSEARVFTALAVAMLARDGVISLDDAARRHVPELPPYAAAVTVRQLLHHTSGLADYGVLDPGFDLSDRISEDGVFRALSRWGRLGFTPGRGHTYSNTDYALLRLLVQRTSGQSLHDYLQTKLFTPLGMRDTRIGADQGFVAPAHALFHEATDSGWRSLLRYRISPVGGIAVTSSADDIARFARALHDPTTGIGSLLEALEQGAPASARTDGFAYGVYRGASAVVPLIEYRGVGNYTYLARVPAVGLSVVTVCNAYAGMDKFGRAVVALFLGADAPVRTVAASQPTPPPAATGAVPISILRSYAGEYVMLDGRDAGVRIDVPDTALVFTLPNGRAFTALTLANRRFSVDLPGAGIVQFTFVESDSTLGGLILTGRELATGELAGPSLRRKVTRIVSPAALRAYVGTYVGDAVDATLYVTVQGGRAMIAARGLPLTALQPELSNDVFRFSFYVARFQRNTAGAVTHLALDATRVKDMRYTRRAPTSSDTGRPRLP